MNGIKMRLRPGSVLLVMLALIGGILAGCGGGSSKGSGYFSVSTGDQLPEFSLQDYEGNEVSSESLLGKPYVIAVFATWCPPCKAELAALESDVWQPLNDKGASVIAINNGDDTRDEIAKFAAENGLSFPVLVDETGSFKNSVGVSVLPQSLVVGPDGRIVSLHVGFTEDAVQSIAGELRALLN